MVVHQHTRVLTADPHGPGVQSTSVADVQAGLQQLAAELVAVYKAATVGPAETQRVVVEFASGLQGRAAVERRVAGENARIAAALCACAWLVQCAMRRQEKFAHLGATTMTMVELLAARQRSSNGCSEKDGKR